MDLQCLPFKFDQVRKNNKIKSGLRIGRDQVKQFLHKERLKKKMSSYLKINTIKYVSFVKSECPKAIFIHPFLCTTWIPTASLKNA